MTHQESADTPWRSRVGSTSRTTRMSSSCPGHVLKLIMRKRSPSGHFGNPCVLVKLVDNVGIMASTEFVFAFFSSSNVNARRCLRRWSSIEVFGKPGNLCPGELQNQLRCKNICFFRVDIKTIRLLDACGEFAQMLVEYLDICVHLGSDFAGALNSFYLLSNKLVERGNRRGPKGEEEFHRRGIRHHVLEGRHLFGHATWYVRSQNVQEKEGNVAQDSLGYLAVAAFPRDVRVVV